MFNSISQMVPNAHAIPSGRRILVVDDHVDSADIIAQALNLNGYEARVAYEPISAIAIATEFEPHVVIVDIKLPTMDGYDLGEVLSMQFPACRFVALTGDTASFSCLRSQWAGFHGHLTKPVGLQNLLSEVSDTRPSGTFARTPTVRPDSTSPVSRQRRERSRIELHCPSEVVRYWTTELCCTENQLRAAVAAVGVGADDVRLYLRNQSGGRRKASLPSAEVELVAGRSRGTAGHESRANGARQTQD